MELDNPTIVLILYCILAFVLAFYPAYLIFPRFIRKMKSLGNTGKDVNKRGNIQVAESGGIVAVFSFSLAMFVISGLASISNYHENIVLPLQAATTVFIAAAIIGFIDDWGLLTRRQKAFVIGFAALPLVFLRPAAPQLDLIFRDLDFTHSSFLGVNFLFILFWLVVVPAGVLCAANAFNMAAGYNGLESGIPIISSSFMVLILFLKGRDTGAAVIFLGLIGASVAMYIYNRYPAKVFVGDVGTLGIGATYATAAIIGNIAIFAVIAILPMFFEFFATFYYVSKGKERRTACHHPILLPDGRIKTPKGCGYYTLAYYYLKMKPLKEPQLVNKLLSLYLLCGLLALATAFI